ncbi:INO80 complex subunit B [Chelonus insularis]|uniref:INO80 complex subunit B n=1 Tax=Chelonus insularis TaxID=460826 RepID=UPI00158C1906|nr:INO80 complex subunit B [Chelonus insularis]
MGKPKVQNSNTDLNIESNVSSQKRHKKHKHKKHKKKKILHASEASIIATTISNNEIIEKKKIVNKSRSKKDEDKGVEKPRDKTPKSSHAATGTNTSTSPKVASKKKVSKSGNRKDSGTSSEEERWLDAIESGKLEEVDDELKKIKPKDPKLMTARQRAMFERKTDTEPNPGVEQLVSLPTGYKEKVMTAEAIQKAALKSLKRKQLADEKREKDKKKTMERLLKKQESKMSKLAGKGKPSKRQVPLMTYTLTVDGSSISLPPGMDFPLSASKAKETPGIKFCGVQNCPNPKKYACSRTGIPLCSLECYKANLAAILA